MTDAQAISDHWGRADVYSRFLEAVEAAGIDAAAVTIEDLAPVHHLHASGLPATVEAADALPVRQGDRLIDIDCGLGGHARHLAAPFACHVEGIDITGLSLMQPTTSKSAEPARCRSSAASAAR